MLKLRKMSCISGEWKRSELNDPAFEGSYGRVERVRIAEGESKNWLS
jgi:hypothetical protein